MQRAAALKTFVQEHNLWALLRAGAGMQGCSAACSVSSPSGMSGVQCRSLLACAGHFLCMFLKCCVGEPQGPQQLP
jgi:hypothetical protein